MISIKFQSVSNAPKWSKDVTKLMNPKADHDWRLLASRLGYTPDDIRAFACQPDPCLSMLSDWYAGHKTSEATHAVLTTLQEMNRLDAAIIVENAMKAVGNDILKVPLFIQFRKGMILLVIRSFTDVLGAQSRFVKFVVVEGAG